MYENRIQALEDAIRRDHGNIAGIVAQKNGETVYEGYFNGYTASDALHIYSVTKSVFSALIGVAIDHGHIKSVEQKVLEFFPEYTVPAGETTIREVTIKHLLTMTAPYTCEEEPYEAFFESENWVHFALNLLGGAAPAGEFRYSPIVGAHILAGILVSATGKQVLPFARAHLFAPLEIDVPRDIVLRSKEEHIAIMGGKRMRGWAVDPQGIHAASWGLFLSPRDMAKIGRLYLQGGVWGGKRLLSQEWIAESTRAHSHWGTLPYGYLWWIIDEQQQAYAAMGDGGNVIYINPKQQAVVAIASLFMPNAGDRLELIQAYVAPLLEAHQ